MIAVVTGSSGFIGSHLVDALLARNATVRVVVRPESVPLTRDPRVKSFTADLLDDRSLRQSPVWRGATHVFHLAGVTRARSAGQFRAGNVVPAANVLAAIAANAAAPRVVLVSSQAAAGPASDPARPVRESDRPLPIEPYGASKLQAEQASIRYRDLLPITIVRPSAVYGPGDRDFLAVFKQASGPVALHGAPSQQRFSCVHVSDLVDGLLRAAESPSAAGRTYFMANDAPITWRELYDHVSVAAERAPFHVQLPLVGLRLAAGVADLVGAMTGYSTLLTRSKIALARPQWWICDASLARAELGWTPEIPLQRGVRETYLWYLANGWIRSPKVGRPLATSAGAQ